MENLINKKFNFLTAKQFSHKDKKYNSIWIFSCECGLDKKIRLEDVLSGHTKSCGCRQSHYTHRMTKTNLFRIWCGIKNRCLNPNEPSYKYYGGRGISICDRWLENFENFLSDMGQRPSKQYSIDRINNDGNYEPSNCRWATAKEQANNQRKPKSRAGKERTVSLL